jgi:hypothetical protein
MSVCEKTVRPMDGMFEPSGMALDLTRSRRVVEALYVRIGPWQAFNAEVELTLPSFIQQNKAKQSPE